MCDWNIQQVVTCHAACGCAQPDVSCINFHLILHLHMLVGEGVGESGYSSHG